MTAIGYQTLPPAGGPTDGGIVANQNGWVEPGVYVVGWAKRGPSGTIPTNGPDSRGVVELISRGVTASGKAGASAINALLERRHVRRVNFQEWEKISKQEFARAITPQPRERFTRVDEMLAILG